MAVALDLIQLAALVAILIGVALWLPLALVLIVDGAIVLGVSMIIEERVN